MLLDDNAVAEGCDPAQVVDQGVLVKVLRRADGKSKVRRYMERIIDKALAGGQFALSGNLSYTSKAYFDTNTSNHNHFFHEQDGELIDIPGNSIRVDGLPQPPEGTRISHIDVVVRLVKK